MAPRTSPEVGGMGHAVKRKEDPRFIRGQGTYVDDIELPGMLYLDIVRSPYAHATIKNIDASKALAIPGVLDVITGAAQQFFVVPRRVEQGSPTRRGTPLTWRRGPARSR